MPQIPIIHHPAVTCLKLGGFAKVGRIVRSLEPGVFHPVYLAQVAPELWVACAEDAQVFEQVVADGLARRFRGFALTLEGDAAQAARHDQQTRLHLSTLERMRLA